MKKAVLALLAVCSLLVGSILMAAPTHAAATTQSVGFPMYEYPTIGNLWQDIFDAGSQVPWFIANPGSGPGASVDPTYTTYLNNKPASQRAIGYVHTNYHARPITEVLEDIDDWYTMYPQISGIFVDLMKNGGAPADVCYAATLHNYIKSRHPNDLVVMNPGANTEFAYERYGDIFINAENTRANYMSWTPLTDGFENSALYANRFMHIVHTSDAADLATTLARTRTNNAGWVLITDEGMPNPYMAVPSYWSSFLSSVGSLPQTTIPNRGLSGMFVGCLDTSLTTSNVADRQIQQVTNTISNTVNNDDSTRFVPGVTTIDYDLPTGATFASLGGTGWSCSTATGTCTNANNIPADSELPVLTATVTTSCNYSSGYVMISLTNFAGDNLLTGTQPTRPDDCPASGGSGSGSGQSGESVASSTQAVPTSTFASTVVQATEGGIVEETTTSLTPGSQASPTPESSPEPNASDTSHAPETSGPNPLYLWGAVALVLAVLVGVLLWWVARRAQQHQPGR